MLTVLLRCPYTYTCVSPIPSVFATVKTSGFRMEPEEVDGKPGSRITTITWMDPSGMIPTALVNATAKKQPMTLLKMRKYLDEIHGGK